MEHPIKAWRTGLDLNMDQAAARLGVERTTVWRWEKGAKIPLERIPAIAALTGLSREKLRPDVWSDAA